MKVRSDGYVALVREPGVIEGGRVTAYVTKERNQDYISMPRERSNTTPKEFFPMPGSDCGEGACRRINDNACLCGRSDGYVALVHNSGVIGGGSVAEYVSKEKSQDYISMPWERTNTTLKEFFPKPGNGC
eukprot:6695566-Ditylum_brightwellii.AAC.1